MKKFIKNKLFKRSLFSGIAVLLVVGGFFVYQAKAAVGVQITPATGGTGVSIDTTSSAGGTGVFTDLTGLIMTELLPGEIGAGLHVLTLPEGWEFDTTQSINISIGGSGELLLANQWVTPSHDTLSFRVNAVSSSATNSLNFSSIKVRPHGTISGVNGDITHSGADIYTSHTNYGSLSSIPGAITKLAITTQPTNIVYGALVSSVVLNTQDKFNNNSTSGLAANANVNLSKQAGAGTLSGTVIKDIGTLAGNGTVTFSDLSFDNVGVHQLTTGNGLGYTNVNSDTFTISQKPLSATITVVGKNYDGDNTAVISTRTPGGVVGGDTITLSDGTATYDNKNAGAGKVVSATGLTLGGAQAAKYTFDGVASGTGVINALETTVGGAFTANNKIYDGELSATGDTSGLTLAAKVFGDNLTLVPVLNFSDEDVANGLVVSLIAGSALSGADSGNYTLSLVGAPTDTANITPRELILSGGIVPNSKTYNANTTATLASFSLVLSGKIGADAVSFDWDSINFDNANIGSGKTVTAQLVTTGADKDNYTLPNSGIVTSSAGVITPVALTITNEGTFTANNKVYDGGTGTTVLDGSGLTLNGKIGAETVTLTPVLAFSDKNVANGKTISIISSSTLGGADASNYVISLDGAPTTTANITKKAVTLTAQTDTKEYDGGTDSDSTPVLTGGLVAGDIGIYSQTFAAEVVNTGINLTPAVTSIKDAEGLGTDMTGNYDVSIVVNGTGVITAKPLTVTGAVVTPKVYDGGLVAAITGSSLSGVVDGDTVSLANNTAGVFANKNVANDISVATSPMTLAGADAGNYSLTQPTLTGNITQKPIIITAQTDTKVYDETTSSDSLPLDNGALVVGDTGVYYQTYDTSSTGIGKTLNAAVTSILDGALADMRGNYSYTFVTNNTGVIQSDALDHFNVTSSTLNPNSGTPFTLTITAVDHHDNIISAANGVAPYTGVLFISTTATAPYTLPQSYAFVAGNEGTRTFTNGVILNAVQDDVVVSVRDSSNAAIVGSLTGIDVSTDVDSVKPVISVVSATSTKTTAGITFTSNESGLGKVAYSYGSFDPVETSYVALTSAESKTINLSNLICGTTYSYTIYAKDASGNEQTSASTFNTLACDVIDSTNPVISAVTSTSTKVTAGITFTSSEAGLGKVAYSYGSLTPIVTDYVSLVAATPKTINLGNLICGTTYSYTIYAKDASGNESTSSSTFSTAACDAIVLGVTNTRLVKSRATKNGTPADGWHWILDVTVPNASTTVKMKFDNLTGAGNISANNIHFYSEQSSTFASAADMADIVTANTLSTDSLLLDEDIDGNSSNGRQIQIKIQAGVPEVAFDGAYSAGYEIVAEEVED